MHVTSKHIITGHQRNAILMAFRWWADSGLIIHIDRVVILKWSKKFYKETDDCHKASMAFARVVVRMTT